MLTPNRCGLHETTRDLVMGLRALGVDSRLVDPFPETNPVKFSGAEDRGAPVADVAWAKGADLLISHSGLNQELNDSGKPFVLAVHGRPRSSFLIERNGGTAVVSYYARLNTAKRLRAVVTFWPEHEAYLRVLMPDQNIQVVPSCADLDYWSPGPRGYEFGGKKGRVNVVCSDAWRDDVDPYYPLNAYALWAREIKGAKLHVYAKPQKAHKVWDALLNRIDQDGNLGEVKGWVTGLRTVYRTADVVLTANDIDVRTVRESMGCGCPVVRVGTDLRGFRTQMAQALDTPREAVRGEALRRFDPKEAAKQFKAVLEAA